MNIPSFFQNLITIHCLSFGDVQQTRDGFFALSRSLSDILAAKGISVFPNDQGQERQCSRFYDDWYLYAVPEGEGYIYSLFKMREQEFDASEAVPADGDTPGVTVSFIVFDTAILTRCLSDPQSENRAALNREINRVVAARGQQHHKALKAYFLDPKAEGSYLIGELYVRKIASFAQNGAVQVPKHYRAVYERSKKPGASFKDTRLPRFLNSNNQAAGHCVCDHETIFIADPQHLTDFEKAAILATHTANVSFHSFAAEVRYHAQFLAWYARVPLPFLGKSIYDSAIRADMTIDDTELEGPAPFYRLDSKLVKEQVKYHGTQP